MLSKFWNSLRVLLARPVDGGSLAVARMVVGLVVLLTTFDLIKPKGDTSLLRELYTSEYIDWRAPYRGFEWLPSYEEPTMELIGWAMAASGLLVMLGCCYRPAVIVATVLRSYFFLLDASYYNNHYYLECLLLVLLCFMPAANQYSVDRWWRRWRGQEVVEHIPFWPVFLLRAQLFVVYFFGGIAKLNEFYLAYAFPLRTALMNPKLAGNLSWLLSEEQLNALRLSLNRSEVAYALSYAGLIYDLSVGFLLLYRPTRWIGIALTVLFHLLNHFILFEDIGWFPLLGIGTVTIFLEPDWPRQLWNRWRGKPATTKRASRLKSTFKWPPLSTPATALVCLWLLWQSLMPLRHWLIAGDVNWTDEGGWFSWRMKAHHKLNQPTVFRIEDDVLLELDENNLPEIVWEEWPGPKRLLQDIDNTRINWRSLPPLLSSSFHSMANESC